MCVRLYVYFFLFFSLSLSFSPPPLFLLLRSLISFFAPPFFFSLGSGEPRTLVHAQASNRRSVPAASLQVSFETTHLFPFFFFFPFPPR